MKNQFLIFAGLIILIVGGFFLIQKMGAPKVTDTASDYVSPTIAPTKPILAAKLSDNLISSPTPKKMQLPSTAIIKTSKGDISLKLNTISTPATVANFAQLASSGFYNGTKFHRIIKNFMNQGGDPLTKDDSKKDLWGTGGPGYRFADEIGADNRNDVGTIAMANSGPNTNGSQFFINVVNNFHLDSKHTVFGIVTSGMDVVKAINEVATDDRDRPLDPVTINSIELK